MMTSSLPRFDIFLFLLSVHHPTKNRDEPVFSCDKKKYDVLEPEFAIVQEMSETR